MTRFSKHVRLILPSFAGPPYPEAVNCHKGQKCNHIVQYEKHFNKKVWDTYFAWEKKQKVAGECPECGTEVKRIEGKTCGDSIQRHKIDECQNYPYGKKK